MAKIIKCCCFKRSENGLLHKKRILLFSCFENEADSDKFFYAIKQTIFHITNNFLALVTEKLIRIKLLENWRMTMHFFFIFRYFRWFYIMYIVNEFLAREGKKSFNSRQLQFHFCNLS